MKTILVPTDFSEKSINALEYALEMNKKFHAEIGLFHSYFIPLPATEIPTALPDESIIRKAAQKSLNEIKERCQGQFPDMIFKSTISEGLPEIEILEEEIRKKCDMLVMGTHGTNTLKKFLIGSNTSVIIERSTCPVIAVPEHARFKQINKIVFAANYGVDDYKNVFDLVDFAQHFDSEIILLHVSTGDHEKAFDYNQLNSFKDQVAKETGYSKISFKLFEDKNIYEGLNLYLDDINADMFTMSMRNRSFFKRVFQPSLTKKMAYHTHLPILVFHTDI